MPTTPEQIVEEARKKWPQAGSYVIRQPSLSYCPEGYKWLNGECWIVGGDYQLLAWPPTDSGIYLPTIISAPTLDALLAKLTPQDTKG